MSLFHKYRASFRSLFQRAFLLVLLAGSFSKIPLWANNTPREFRGIWVATVNNLDWPSKPGMNVEQMKNEIRLMLNTLDHLNFNAVIFQIRPAADAFYRSEQEPWSKWLSGMQGNPPPGNWDPLSFMIDECHKRAIELHAWLNPFRVCMDTLTPLSPQNVAVRHPEWVLTYGNKRYLDPGLPEVRDYLNQVVAEVVKKYDIDAIHFDDYFYPYPISGKTFPDSLSFRFQNRGYLPEEREHWRRDNVDLIIETLSKSIKQLKPRVKFGISPFGVWKNFDENDELAGSVTSAGNTNFDNLYADVLKWQRLGWIDYLIPQLYWEIGHPDVDYITLCNWWNERAFGRHIYIGHALYKLAENNSPAWKNIRELPEQISISRRMKNIRGNACFRMRFLTDNPLGIRDIFQKQLYTKKSLLPQMAWIDPVPPAVSFRIRPRGFFQIKQLLVKYPLNKQPEPDLLGYRVYYTRTKNSENKQNNENLLGFFPEPSIDIRDLPLPGKGTYFLWITAIDRHQNESAPVGGIKRYIPK
ncbi:MAG TPA: family 10 glycosylhydrolase [Prolixibacteraceae bacterium]|nr:family 10 glycosylhydrolase [Prolixibacteraceae bacterium]